MSVPADHVTVGVLVDGRSRRMGVDKALLVHPSGETYVEHVVGVAAGVCPEVVMLGTRVTPPPALGRLVRLPDARAGAGPLGGLASLLAHAKTDWVMLLSCDLPLLAAATLRRLLEAADVDADADANADVVAYVHQRAESACQANGTTHHACCALYHRRTGGTVRVRLNAGNYRVQDLLASLRVRSIVPTAEDQVALLNVNDAADGDRARRLWAERPGPRP